MRQEHFVAGTIVAIVGLAVFAYFLSAGSNVAVAGFLGPIPFGAGNDWNFAKLATVLTAMALLAFTVVAYLIPRRRFGLNAEVGNEEKIINQ